MSSRHCEIHFHSVHQMSVTGLVDDCDTGDVVSVGGVDLWYS